MVVTVSGSQQTLLERGHIDPIYLIEITGSAGTLRFCNGRAVTYLNNVYQPYLLSVGTHRVSAHFPDNHTSTKEFQLEFRNDPITWDGTDYTYLSHTFETDVFDWELADCEIKILLDDAFTDPSDYVSDEAMPLVTNGVIGTPQQVNRDTFILPVVTRNIILNDKIKMRVVTEDDFPDADDSILNGRTYIPILIGQDVRVSALTTDAGPSTTVRTAIDTGTTLEVSDVSGFAAGNSIIVGGFTSDPLTIGAVDSVNNQFTGLSPNISTLPAGLAANDVVRENKASYNYVVANHLCGNISAVYVDDILIDSAKYSKASVADSDAIGGFRTEVQFNELIVFGEFIESVAPTVSQQPETSVDDANHLHNVSLDGSAVTTLSFSSSISPAGKSAANDGSESTSAQLDHGAGNQFEYDGFSSLDGTYSTQRAYMQGTDQVSGGEMYIITAGITLLTIIGSFGITGTTVIEFRTASTNQGSETSDLWIRLNDITSPPAWIHEAWKEVTMGSSVNEDLVDLTDTTRFQDVEISAGADSVNTLEVGEKVEVVIDGAQANKAIYGGSGTIERPDYIMRWFLEEVCGETSADIINESSYTSAGSDYTTNSYTLAFAIQKPIKLDTLFDLIAEQSHSIHFWGRQGHTIKYLEDADNLESAEATITEDENGIVVVDWKNSFSALDIRNKLTALYDRTWVQDVNKSEAYAGRVIRQDLDSQTLYGIIENEVYESEQALYFDYITNQTQAENVLGFVVGDKAFPHKEMTIEGAWTLMNLEPGDVVDIVSPTTLNTINARILENQIDPRFFCRTIVKEAAQTATTGAYVDLTDHQVCLYLNGTNEAIADLSPESVGIANAWSIAISVKVDSGEQYGIFFNATQTATADNSAIRIDMGGYGPNDAQILCWDSSGNLDKQYMYDDFWLPLNTWAHVVLTWNGTTLQLYKNGNSVAPDWTPTNNSMTQAEFARRISVGSYIDASGDVEDNNSGFMIAGHFYSVAVWSSALSSSEVSAIYNSGNVSAVDLSAARGSYGSQNNLERWWRLGKNSSVLGEDSAGSRDLDTERNISAANIISDYPSGA